MAHITKDQAQDITNGEEMTCLPGLCAPIPAQIISTPANNHGVLVAVTDKLLWRKWR
jgi:hypothetical protein